MAIFLYTDFGAADLYAGQMRMVLAQCAPGTPVVDLFHDAPPFNVKANAHLIAALVRRLTDRAVVVAVVDPGVGSARRPLAIEADARWYVGPDNGLLSIIAARADRLRLNAIRWRPPRLPASFHGRDLFAPVAAMIAQRTVAADALAPIDALEVALGAEDAAEIIYIDHFGNALTGLRAADTPRERRLAVGRRRIPQARVFSEVKPGALFWYENSLGLIEIAANGASAARALRLTIGQPVALV